MTTQQQLTGRHAKCGCGQLEPSSPSLAFFEYLGPGSAEARDICQCGFHREAHDDPARRARLSCKHFIARGPSPTDRFYCGHRGWD
jgi:hypothetical protein